MSYLRQVILVDSLSSPLSFGDWKSILIFLVQVAWFASCCFRLCRRGVFDATKRQLWGERGTSVTQIFASKQCQMRRGICSGGKTPLLYSFSFLLEHGRTRTGLRACCVMEKWLVCSSMAVLAAQSLCQEFIWLLQEQRGRSIKCLLVAVF